MDNCSIRLVNYTFLGGSTEIQGFLSKRSRFQLAKDTGPANCSWLVKSLETDICSTRCVNDTLRVMPKLFMEIHPWLRSKKFQVSADYAANLLLDVVISLVPPYSHMLHILRTTHSQQN